MERRTPTTSRLQLTSRSTRGPAKAQKGEEIVSRQLQADRLPSPLNLKTVVSFTSSIFTNSPPTTEANRGHRLIASWGQVGMPQVSTTTPELSEEEEPVPPRPARYQKALGDATEAGLG